MDKGYDSEDIPRLIHVVLDFSSLIPRCEIVNEKGSFGISGGISPSLLMKKCIANENNVETVFSVIKKW